jgi:plasmid replication initiation protein
MKKVARGKRFGPIQKELFAFTADAPFVSIKGLEPLMGTSWFSMEKHRTKPIKHTYKNYWVEVEGKDHGIATYWDQDILLFAVSQIIGGQKRGEEVSRKVRFTGNDLFEFTGQKWVGAKSYEGLVGALRRLQGTKIRTSLNPTKNIVHAERGISWIESYKTLRARDNRTGFEIILPEHVMEWASHKRNWLTLDRSYFDLMGGLERFLYLWGRKATGYTNGDRWEESFASIYEKSASTAAITKFRYNLAQIIKHQTIVGYHLDEYKDYKRGRVLVLERDINHPLLLKPAGKIRKRQLRASTPEKITQMKLDI